VPSERPTVKTFEGGTPVKTASAGQRGNLIIVFSERKNRNTNGLGGEMLTSRFKRDFP